MKEGPADWVVGAFMLVRTEALVEAGQFDERFFLYSEEVDWCIDCSSAGGESSTSPS